MSAKYDVKMRNVVAVMVITILHSSLFTLHLNAQRHTVYSDNIRSLQVVAGNRWQELPIITKGSGDRVTIAFDELSHDYHRYTYRVVHLEKDWTESEELMEADYISGFQSDLTIEDYEESINTTQNYTHYQFKLPNKECRLRISGNYRVDVYDSDDANDNRVLSAYFMVNENAINVGTGYSGDTDIDTRRNHQQVTVKLDYSDLKPTDPREQITGYLLQNYRWDNMRKLPYPTSINQQYMEWSHCRDLIFEGGNEYHKFEILDIHRNSFHVENNTWDSENEMWHTYVWPDYRRASYSYDEVPKGAFLIRNSDNREIHTTSEYVMVHFTLQTAELFPYPVYAEGMWGKQLMTYDKEQKAYTCAVPLKYGYYSYQYLMMKPDGTSAVPPTEGSFYETRNKYTALIYYRGTLDRTDRLVGVSKN